MKSVVASYRPSLGVFIPKGSYLLGQCSLDAADQGPGESPVPESGYVVLADFIQEGHFSRHIRRMRLLYNERRNVLLESIHRELGRAIKVAGAQAGMRLSVIIKGVSDSQVAQRAAKENLWLVPLSSSYLGKSRQEGFVLGSGSSATEDIPDAVRKLRTLLDSGRELGHVGCDVTQFK